MNSQIKTALFLVMVSFVTANFNIKAQAPLATPQTSTTYTVAPSNLNGSSGLDATGIVVDGPVDIGVAKGCFDESFKNPVIESLNIYDEYLLKEIGPTGRVVTEGLDLVLMTPIYYYTVSPVIDSSWFQKNERVRSALKSLINNHIKDQKLNPYQQFCFISCVVSTFITYKIKLSNIVDETAYTGEGDCKNFSWMFQDLATSAELSVNVVHSKNNRPKDRGYGHAFNDITINGRRYIFEPQSRSCLLYNDSINDSCTTRSYMGSTPVTIGRGRKTAFLEDNWKYTSARGGLAAIKFNLNGSVDITDNHGKISHGNYTYNSVSGAEGNLDITTVKAGGRTTIPDIQYSCTYKIEVANGTCENSKCLHELRLQCINIDTGECL